LTRRLALGALALALFALPASASAATILLGPPNLAAADPFATCDALAPEFCTAKTFIPTALSEPGAMLVAPADGTITSWRVRGAPPGKLRLRIVEDAGAGQFTGIATSGIAKVSDGKGDTPTAISIGAGQQLGVSLENAPLSSTPSVLLGNSAAPGAAWSAYFPGLPDEVTASPTATGSGSEPLFNATVLLATPLLFNLTSTVGPESGGEIVAINGFHLAIATSVSFGGRPAQVLSARNNQIVVATPPHPPGPVSVTVTTAGGSNPDSPANLYTYTPVAPPASDTSAPQLSGLSISPAAFTAKQGADISFRSSEAATVRFTLQRKPRRSAFRTIRGSFTAPAQAGPNRLRFDAKWNGRALSPGRYRLLAVGTDALGYKAKPKRRAFKVLAASRRR
jgi:IPT/TIG domain